MISQPLGQTYEAALPFDERGFAFGLISRIFTQARRIGFVQKRKLPQLLGNRHLAE